jgi:predicted Fe-S protein YdhL (DUF1289 family)
VSATAIRRTAATNELASPCISVCEMDAASGLCRGCLRTLDEIAAWSVLDADGKKAVLSALTQRRAAHPHLGAR